MAISEKQLQKDIKRIWVRTQKQLKALGKEAVVLAHKGEQEVVRAAKMGRIQIDVLNIKRKQDRIHQEIGRRIVALSRKGKLELPSIKTQVERSVKLSRQIRSREINLKKARKPSSKKSR